MKQFKHESLRVCVCDSPASVGKLAARHFARKAQRLLLKKQTINVIFSGAKSQGEFHAALRNCKGIPWERIQAFPVDEFWEPTLDSSLRVAAQVERDLYRFVPIGKVNRINWRARDPETERKRYEAILRKTKIDIACLGIGLSGHIALNEPDETDFNDPQMARVVTVCEKSKKQLLKDPNFNVAGKIPNRGITVTLSALMNVPEVMLVVPYKEKARVISQFFRSKITTSLPASIMKSKTGAVLFLDQDSFRSSQKIKTLP